MTKLKLYRGWPRRVCPGLLLLFACAFSGQAHAQSDELGKRIFNETANPPCAVCHSLKAAGATGEVGPSLDELKPDEGRVRQAVKDGVGAMPPFGDSLSEAQISAVAKFVAKSVK